MCFSASASFVSSAVLGGVGVATAKKVRKKEEYALAAVPWFFAVQQFMEGVVWLEMGSQVGTVAAYVFLVFAMMIWPFWIPFTSYLIEPKGWRKRWMVPFIVIGAAISLTIFVRMLNYELVVDLYDHHINYWFKGFNNYDAWTWFYVAAVSVAPFLSSHKLIRAIGVVAFVSFLVSIWFFQQVFVSVWCFFAAVVSVSILFYFKKPKGLSRGR